MILKTIYLSLIIILSLGLSLASASENNCLTCHQEFEDETGPSYKIKDDIHIMKGLSCNDCHGGDPKLDDMDDVRDSKGYRGVPSHLEIPKFCASCHSDVAYMHEHNPSLPTDQFDKYKTSIHGQRLTKKRDKKVANCVSCHGVHDIGDPNMPNSTTHPQNLPATCGNCHSDVEYMAEYKISTTQVEDYKQSVHGKAVLENGDFGAPVCNDCHGNHGTAPPGIASIAFVCGNCHAFEAEMFNKSPHKDAFVENDFPMCETCHSNHKILKPHDNMIGTHDESLCANCHSKDDGTKGFENAVAISESIGKLVVAHKEAENILNRAIEKGMMTTDEEFRLREVEQILILTRATVHTFDKDEVFPKADTGIKKADTVKTNSAALIDEYYFRRKGLGIATLFITMLSIGLYIFIKRMK